MTVLSIPGCQVRPAGWCVAGPGTLNRPTHARLIAATARPTFATTVWACGWCGRPPAFPEVLSTGGRVSGHGAHVARRAIFDFYSLCDGVSSPRWRSPQVSV